MEDSYLMVHEFLYLMCNSQDRCLQIEQNHKIKLNYGKEQIKIFESNTVQKIHILAPLVNNSPHNLVTRSLDQMPVLG